MANDEPLDPRVRKAAEEITKKLADQGLIIEGGWTAFKIVCKLEQAPEQELKERRITFFAGALHLFTSALTMLEPGQEPTEKDFKRMSAIADELKRFEGELKRTLSQRN